MSFYDGNVCMKCGFVITRIFFSPANNKAGDGVITGIFLDSGNALKEVEKIKKYHLEEGAELIDESISGDVYNEAVRGCVSFLLKSSTTTVVSYMLEQVPIEDFYDEFL